MEKLEPGTAVTVGSHRAEVVAYIAEGGFAHIYRVKCTPQENGSDDAVLKRVVVKTKPELNLLRKEVDTMKRLAHSKYVVRYYDSHAQKLEDGTYEVLLLMEHCPNKSLLDYMNMHLKTKLRVDQITKIMFQITQALADMHRLKLIHRDLKIENVLIDKDGNFKLADFGSASVYLPPPTNQEEFQLVAHDIIHNTTPQYRAPEMIDLYRGLPIDNKSDTWALGVFLFKLMYYITPFETQGELAILHGYFQFPELPKYPSRLKNLVIIMLQVNPMLRPNMYQVLCEICDMINKPVPIEDDYGLGKYDFDAYAKYQQHIQLQQQQQAQLQQQYFQQKMQQQQLQQQHVSPQPHAATPVPQLQAPQPQPTQTSQTAQPDEALNPQKSYQSIHPQELTRSSKSSVGDLKSLGESLEREKTSSEGGSDAELEDAEERFPELDQIDDIEAVKEKYPDLDGIGESTSQKNSMDVSRGASQKSSMEVQRVASSQSARENEVPNIGLKFSKTEAWTVEPEDVGVEVDGVFHKAEPEKQTEETPKERIKTKSSFDNLFDFESDPSPPTVSSFSQPSSRVASNAQPQQRVMSQPPFEQAKSRNPFPTKKNPFPTAQPQPQPQQLEVKKVLRPERSGGNPWAQYTKPQTQLQPAVQPSSQQLFQSKSTPAPPPKPPRPTENTPPQHTRVHSQLSPSITLTTTEEKLIDIDDETHTRPKLDLNLHNLELANDGGVNDENEDDTDTDSNGDLRVEVMKVRTNSSVDHRASGELSRLKLDLEELDLDGGDKRERERESRRSMSLKRDGLRKSSRSRSDNEKRKSFLGF